MGSRIIINQTFNVDEFIINFMYHENLTQYLEKHRSSKTPISFQDKLSTK